MKTSNALLIAVLVVTGLALTGFNLVLKAEYGKIDFKDPYYGYVLENLPPFKVLRLRGSYSGLAQIQQGKESQIRIREWGKKDVKWQLRGDTLEVSWHKTGNTLTFTAPATPLPPIPSCSLPPLPFQLFIPPALPANSPAGRGPV